MKILALSALSALALCGAANADVSISSKPTSNMSCDAGVCTATAQKAVLNVADLQNMLGNGDVTVKTGTAAKDIDIDQPLTWSSTSRLSLDAQRSVTVKKKVAVNGVGALTITTNDGGSGGDLYFFGKGRVTFDNVASSLIINGNTYTLAGNLSDLVNDLYHDNAGFYALARSYDNMNVKFFPLSSFSGILEGLGQRIDRLRVTHGYRGCQGFFAQLRGSVRDLSFHNAKVSSRQQYAGIVAGCVTGGAIVNVRTDGQVSDSSLSDGAAGGLAGSMNTGLILTSQSSASVSAAYYAGGLVGTGYGAIEQSFATGAVSGKRVAGGLSGFGPS